MTRRLIVTYLTITAFALVALSVPLGITFAHREKEQVLFDIERDADAMAGTVQRAVGAGVPFTRADITQYGSRTGGYVIVVDADGRALLDTQHPGDPGRDYATDSRPEILAALQGRRVEGSRHSDTLGTDLLYAAVPTTSNGRVTGAVRITYPSAALDTRVRRMWARIALLCLAVLLAVAAVGYLLARSVTRPVRRLERASDRLAEGDLSARVDETSGPPELRHLATTFNRMADRLAHLVDAQQRFVADASHQLRTPLTALRLRLENLGMHTRASDREAIDATTAEVTRMSRLVDALLFMARDSANAQPPVALDLAVVVRQRAEAWSDTIEDRGVDLRVDGPASTWALAVPDAIEQIVDNLLDNALTVSPPGATISVRVTASDQHVEVHVVDEGSGLDDTERDRAFERFWRGPGAAPGGTGLGLAVVRQLVDACGGEVRLDAAPTHGIDAVVVLRPAAQPRAAAVFTSR